MKQRHLYLQKFLLLTLSVIVLYACHGRWESTDVNNVITISGRILDQTTSQPLDSALVKITSPAQFVQSTITDSTGQFHFEITSEKEVTLSIEASKNLYGPQSLTVSATSGTDKTGVNLELIKDTNGGGGSDGGGEHGKGAANIQLATNPPEFINIAETGDLVSAPLTFQVVDSAGQPLTAQNAVDVEFEITNGPNGKEKLIPEKITTNDQGKATTTLYSGNKAGVVKLQAVIQADQMGFQMKSSPVNIAIHGGFPDEEHFDMSISQQNIDVADSTLPTVNVSLGDQFSNPVRPGTAVSFNTSGGVIQGSANTDEDGNASVQFTSLHPSPSDGKVSITASTVNADNTKIQKQVDLIFSTPEAKVSATPTTFDIQAGDSQKISYTVTDDNGNPMAAGTHIRVQGPDSTQLTGDTDVTLADNLTTGSGKTDFSFTLQNNLRGTKDQANQKVSISVTSPSGKTTLHNNISGTLRGNAEPAPPPPAADIELITPPQDAIRIAATGENVSTPMTFQVLDEAGNPLSASQAVEVHFNLTSSPGGDVHFDPSAATTNDQGQVTTKLISGNKAGVVQVQASVKLSNGQTIKSDPVQVTIHGGFPYLPNFIITASQQNTDAASTKPFPVINVTLGDQFNNPVAPNTAVYFTTSGGVIQGSANTDEDGNASVQFTSLHPSPSNGKVSVTASTVNADNTKIQKQVDLIFSTPEAKVSATPTTFDIQAGDSQKISYTVTDDNGNPMAKGTHIKVEGDDGVQLSGDTNVTLGDYIATGQHKTAFGFTIQDNGQSQKENINITITVTAPAGEPTVYTDILGKRVIEGSEQVGAAAIALIGTPKSSININETGDDVSAPLTFEVRDSLGRPLTAENKVDVQFKLVNSPGGGEDLVPHTATTDGEGKVTTTLFSGNKAGAVKVQAFVERTSIGLTVKSKPVVIAIHGGFPDEAHFSIAPAKHNFEGYDINNQHNEITVVLGDKFSNPVKPGTIVYFNTSGGIIQGSGNTDEDGITHVDLISGDPRSVDGKATVTASTVNENDQRIQKTTEVIFSTSRANITASPTNFTIPNNGGQKFTYTVTDLNGNPMAAGTKITVNAGSSVNLTGDVDFTLGDHLNTGAGSTQFNFSASDADGKTTTNDDVTIKISVTTPSGNTTTFTNIQGVVQGVNKTGNPKLHNGN